MFASRVKATHILRFDLSIIFILKELNAYVVLAQTQRETEDLRVTQNNPS